MVYAADSWQASRRLLRRVRDIMAAEASSQDRLSQVVRVIASEMVAEVCSIYTRRSGNVLVLSATQGLKPEAVHVTRLNIGEGLVGLIAENAEPMALSDAQSHPNFAYRPETGEESFHSLMGVPVLRGGRVAGVVVVQNRTRRNYTEDEVETLETVAMVLGEVAANSDLPQASDPVGEVEARRPVRLQGVSLGRGLAIGTAVLHEPRVPVRQMVADDPAAELVRLSQALKEMHAALDAMFAAADLGDAGEHRDVLETYSMFARDRGWLERIREATQGGLTAEAAVRKVQGDMRARMRQVRDPYLRERLHDLDDLSNRLVQHLAGDGSRSDLPHDAILIARSMGPAELLDYPRDRLRGLVLEEGSPAAHVAIVARALDIPVIGRAEDALGHAQPGDLIIVDGDHGQLFIRPGEFVVQTFMEAMKARAARRALYTQLKDTPAVTRDGVAITLYINAGLQIDLHHLDEAAGVGLYRTEVPFMVRDRFPNVEDQIELYSQVLKAAGSKPVVFRTLDIGGDKVLPYWRAGRDENPAMGWRAIRVALDRPFMFRQQLRALLRAAAGRELRLMFPMVTEVAELERARAVLDQEVRRERNRGQMLPDAIRVGAMLEVPALAWQLDALLPRIDFLSVGSNDLLQFLFATDRGNPRLVGRYDALAPAALGLFHHIASRCSAAGVPVTCCGEMTGNPLEAMALLGLGFRAISMPPPAIGPVKMMAINLDVSALAGYMSVLTRLPDHSVREHLRAYAADHAIPV